MEEILHQLRLVVYPITYKVLYIPGGAGFLPSTVTKFRSSLGDWDFFEEFIRGLGCFLLGD